MSEYHAYHPTGHIRAISLLLKNAANFTASKSNTLSNTDYTELGEFAEMWYEQDFSESVYCDAAYSHLVASSLSTFFESFFTYEFHNLRSDCNITSPRNDSIRWNIDPPEEFWDPKKVISSKGKIRDDIFRGIKQLYEALEIPIPIQPEQWLLIEALFLYRNNIVHNGFEWKQETITKFLKTVTQRKTQDYFETAYSGTDIWIIYMKKEFETKLLDLAFELVMNFEFWSTERFRKIMEAGNETEWTS